MESWSSEIYQKGMTKKSISGLSEKDLRAKWVMYLGGQVDSQKNQVTVLEISVLSSSLFCLFFSGEKIVGVFWE